MNNDLHIVLLDIGSIQEYVFGSNRLKENLGGSSLIQNVLKKSYFEKIVTKIGITNHRLYKWKESPEEIKILDDDKIEVETGYIGGGNALLLFRGEDNAKEFIKEWTKSLLIDAPGLKTNVALVADVTKENLGESIKECFNLLAENKMRYSPQVVLPRHGITKKCTLSGWSCEKETTLDDKKVWVSSASYTRLTVSDHFKDMFKGTLGDKYCLTTEIDKLGQSEGEGHIAIVHIDGNGIGQKFSGLTDLTRMRKLAKSLQGAAENSMKELLKDLIEKYNYDDPEKGVLKGIGITLNKDKDKDENKDEDEKIILPIRPIILAGDDITFICDGRLGLYCAEKYTELFIKQDIDDGSQKNKHLSACAGVAIIKTKYPFYRGYVLAEELCGSAKKKAREDDDDSSWIDFHISYGGMSGTIEDIRANRYKTPDGKSLCKRPWKLGPSGNFKDLKAIAGYFYKDDGDSDEKKIPKSKLMALRSALTQGNVETKAYIKALEHYGFELPAGMVSSAVRTYGWQGDETPLFDAIELGKFYDVELMK